MSDDMSEDISDVARRGDERAQKRSRELSAARLLAQLHVAGVPERVFETKVPDLISLGAVGEGFESVLNYVTMEHRRWARRGTYVLIEGGGPFDEDARDKVMHYCLLKAIIARFNEAIVDNEEVSPLGGVTRTFTTDIAKIVDFVVSLPLLTAWEGKSRHIIREMWSKYPVLAIREIDPHRPPRTNTDGPAILDSILRQRRLTRYPTIMTFVGSTEEIAQSITRGGAGTNGSFGGELAKIVSMPHNPEKGVIRMKLGDCTNV